LFAELGGLSFRFLKKTLPLDAQALYHVWL
jgi:hypothetical protein